MTKIVRSLPPLETRAGAYAISALVALQVVADVFIVLGIAYAIDQRMVSWMLGLAFLVGAVTLDVYRKEAIPDELVAKTRIPKVIPKKPIR